MEELKQLIRVIFKEELSDLKAEFSRLPVGESSPQKKFLNVNETAEHLGLAKQTVYIKASKGEIPSHKNGKLYFVREELDAFMSGTWKPSVNSKK